MAINEEAMAIDLNELEDFKVKQMAQEREEISALQEEIKTGMDLIFTSSLCLFVVQTSPKLLRSYIKLKFDLLHGKTP